MIAPAAPRGGGRSWLAVLLASLVALVVAAFMLHGGGAPLRPAGSTDLAMPSVVPVASPLPRTAPSTDTLRTDSERPRWSGDAAEAGPIEDDQPAPRRMIVSRLRVDMPIVATGVSEDGQMALPDQPREIGWYRYGPRPGARTGSAVLAGHVDSKTYGIGPLAELRNLREGDRVSIVREGGQQTYEVRQVVQISKRTVPLEEVFERSGPATLRIVTCGGPFVRSRGGYLDNLVVTAVPL